MHPAVRLISAARTLYAGRTQHDEETILCARETDIAKCMIVEVEWCIPPTAARVPAEPVQCSSDEVSHLRTPEVGRPATAIPSGGGLDLGSGERWIVKIPAVQVPACAAMGQPIADRRCPASSVSRRLDRDAVLGGDGQHSDLRHASRGGALQFDKHLIEPATEGMTLGVARYSADPDRVFQQYPP